MTADREQVPATMAEPIPDQREAPGQAPGPTAPIDPTGGAAPPPRPAPARQPDHELQRTRLSGVWVAVGCFTVILVLLLIFILQNSRTVDVSYLGAHGHLPLGVAMLLAAACGALLVTFAGMARILQLRATARKHRRADRKAAKRRPAA
jgi:lipopolysaccharide assembly protein A